MEREKKVVNLHTMQIVALGFFGVIFLGGVLLWLPISNTEPISFVDALFTSTTAVCVTGLVTVIPAAQFTFFGKTVMMLLIQIGGMGIVVCMVSFFLLMRKRITIRERARIQQVYGLDQLSGMVAFIIRVLKGMFLVEGIGAVLYAFAFVPEFGFWKGVAYGIFHSVSAFCNAGLDIVGAESFMPYVAHPLINITTMLLIVLGGLGFTVWFDLKKNTGRVFREKQEKKRLFTRLSLHSKIVVITTLILIFGGGLLFVLLEYRNPNTFGELSFGQKWLAGMFQSVTTRTAGFATVPQGDLSVASQLLSCVLMFIGGSPAGTAGGIKTATVAMLFLTCRAVIQGKRDTEVFGRRIPRDNIQTGIAVALLALTILLTGVFLISIFEPQLAFMDILFESISAIATVGLSTGITPGLGTASKIVLICLMYIGRIGPMTIALVFGGKLRFGTQFRRLPEKRILVG